MSPDSSPPLDPALSPTECAPGEHPAEPESTIVDDASLDSEVLRGMGDFLDRLGRFWKPGDDSEGNCDSNVMPGSGSFERYELLERVGQGGFGLVFRARDPVLGRDVAIKIPRPEVLLTGSLRRRFLREARAAGALDHPNIVQVHDTGQVGPLCFIASAFCEGPTLSAWLMKAVGPVAVGQVARLIRTLAVALQHAHDRGILHRDLKPSNILLQGDPDGLDLDTFVPRISDFGLAKIADEIGDETRTDVLMGSPPYMAPEQAMGRSREVGPASDVYALGAILYQILTGRPPFEGESRVELLRRIVEAEPAPPRSLRPDLPRDLETICLKCLAKDPRRRYPTAEALADDLGRFLRGEPVRARPTSAWERAAKWCRRRPWQAAALFLVSASLLGSAGVMAWRADTLRRHNLELQSTLDLARTHEVSTRRLLYDSRVRLAQQALVSGNPETSQEILADLKPGPGQADLRGFEWHYLDRIARREVSVLFDRPGLPPDRPEPGSPPSAASADGRLVAAVEPGHPGSIVVREAATRRAVRSIAAKSGQVFDLVLTPDGGLLAASVADRLVIWEVDSGREIAAFAQFPAASLRLSLDGDRLAAISLDGENFCLIADLTTRPALRIRSTNGGRNIHAAFSRDGRSLAIVAGGRHPTIWDTATGREVAVYPRTTGDVGELEFTGDGQSLIFRGDDLRTRCWHFGTRREPVSELAKGDKEVWTLAYSPDGSTLASAGDDHRIRLRDPRDGSIKATLEGHGALVTSVAFSPDGTRLASAGFDNTVRIWDLGNHRESASLTGHIDRVRAVAFSPDGRLVASAGSDQTVQLWDARTGRHILTSPDLLGTVHGVTFNRDGKTLATACNDRTIKGIDVETGAVRFSLASPQRNMASVLSPDGTLLASAGEAGAVTLWDAVTWAKRSTFTGSDAAVRGLAFSPDGKTLATACGDSKVRLWDPIGGQMLLELAGHTQRVNAVAFSPDGKTLASCDHAGAIRLWRAGAE